MMFRKAFGALLVLLLTSARAHSGTLPPRDAIDLSQVTIHSSPADIANWPVTVDIQQLTLRPTGDSLAGVGFTTTQIPDVWNYHVPGWGDGIHTVCVPLPPPGAPDAGCVYYTVWAVVRVNGAWHAAGFITMWVGRPSTGAPILSDFHRNWAYDHVRWGEMADYIPQPGDQMGFFLSAGDARGVTSVTSVPQRSNVVLVSLPANDTGTFAFPTSRHSATPMDFDGDGKADLSVYRPSTAQWFGLESSANFTSSVNVAFGVPGDIAAPGDYDGDGKMDIAVFRPSDGTWYIGYSSTLTTAAFAWGTGGDIPVPGDYDGDGKNDLALYRPSTGQWFILKSSTGYTASLVVAWGASTDTPVPGDYDGDGKTDIAVYRPSTGIWYMLLSSFNFTISTTALWGVSADIPVPGDYDGDGKTDFAVFRPSTGIWYMLLSSFNYTISTTALWGVSTDIPVPNDYDGDGKTDFAVFRPSTGTWFILCSGTGYRTNIVANWGASADLPLH
jgi:hypothetical protein